MKPLSFAKPFAAGLLAAGLLAAGSVWADDDDDDDDDDIRVEGPVQVSGDSPFGPLEDCGNFPSGGINFLNSEVEPWLDVNPTDRDNLVAFWQQDRWSNGGARSNVAGVTFDGGRSWESVVVPGLTECSGGPFERASDPWVSFSPDGTLHQMSLVVNLPTFAGRNGMAVSRSLDGGLSWSPPIFVIDEETPGVLNDKNSLTADSTDSDFVYAVWDRLRLFPAGGFEGPVYLARTTDGGVSWEEAREIFNPGLNNQTIGNQILVLRDGTVINFFNEIVNVLPDGTPNPVSPPFNFAFIRSFDKGATWDAASTKVEQILSQQVSTPDTGDTVRDGNLIFDVAVDPKRGRLYAVWQDARFTGFDQVAFIQSRNRGRTWSTPIRINLTPENAENPLRQQAFLPSVAVSRDGRVAVTYYDFRNDDASGELADHFMVFCDRRCDRRRSWRKEVRLTPESFDYLTAPQAGGLFLGDYMGLAAKGGSFFSFFQQSSADDPGDGFFARVDRGDDDDDDDDDDDG